MVIGGCVISINLYDCETGAIMYVTAVHHTKHITLLAEARGPCYMAVCGMYCVVQQAALYINIV